jgi:hypothetical protein
MMDRLPLLSALQGGSPVVLNPNGIERYARRAVKSADLLFPQAENKTDHSRSGGIHGGCGAVLVQGNGMVFRRIQTVSRCHRWAGRLCVNFVRFFIVVSVSDKTRPPIFAASGLAIRKSRGLERNDDVIGKWQVAWKVFATETTETRE